MAEALAAGKAVTRVKNDATCLEAEVHAHEQLAAKALTEAGAHEQLAAKALTEAGAHDGYIFGRVVAEHATEFFAPAEEALAPRLCTCVPRWLRCARSGPVGPRPGRCAGTSHPWPSWAERNTASSRICPWPRRWRSPAGSRGTSQAPG